MLETPTQSGQGVNVVLEQTWRCAPRSRDTLTRGLGLSKGLRANHFVESGEKVSAGELFFNDGEIDLLGGELEHARNIAHMLVATAFRVPDDFPNQDVLCWCKENFPLRQCGGPTILPRPLEKRVLGAGIKVCF